jgi:hypothetical protein
MISGYYGLRNREGILPMDNTLSLDIPVTITYAEGLSTNKKYFEIFIA